MLQLFTSGWKADGHYGSRVLHRYDTRLWSTGMYVVRIEGENWFHNLKVWIQ